jgi:hypothetical protein
MKPEHQLVTAKPDGWQNRAIRTGGFRTFATAMSLLLLTACEQNTFVAPPPPTVDVGMPVQRTVEIDRVKTQTLRITTDQVFSTLASYLGSSYVNQFNKFGRTFQIYAQAVSQFRLTPKDIEKLSKWRSNCICASASRC